MEKEFNCCRKCGKSHDKYYYHKGYKSKKGQAIFTDKKVERFYCSINCRKEHDTSFIRKQQCLLCLKEFEYNHITTIKKYCLSCSKKAKYKRLNVKNAKIKQELLKTNKCSICNTEYPLSCLAFHHLSDKKFLLTKSNYGRFSAEELDQEVAKTQVMCHNCHAEYHYKERKHQINEISRSSKYKNDLRTRRKQFLIDKMGGICQCCGRSSDIQDVYSFDHIGEKSFQLHKVNLGMKKWADILAESEKCELLCLNCHQSKNIFPIMERKQSIAKKEFMKETKEK
jgi:hypothetical protein